jgi:hypothetical protein
VVVVRGRDFGIFEETSLAGISASLGASCSAVGGE